jgi:hypothetical protein
MQDRPNIDELLEAVSGFLHDDVMPSTTGRLNFHARVAGNVVQMLRRELNHLEEHVESEWSGLDGLLRQVPQPSSLGLRIGSLESRNRELADRIRDGQADSGPWRDEVLQHLRRVTLDKLVVSNPALAAEGGAIVSS